MSEPENPELERRLAALEKGSARAPKTAPRRSPLLALVVVGIIGAGGALLYVLAQPEEEVALPTATPDVFQSEGDGFGAIETLPPPEPEVVFVAPDPVEPNAELLAQISALQAQIEELRNAPEAIVEDNTTAAEAIDALTAQIAETVRNFVPWRGNPLMRRPTYEHRQRASGPSDGRPFTRRSVWQDGHTF
jgi:type IV secretion system protein VirB10